jgi:hypothetical protein
VHRVKKKEVQPQLASNKEQLLSVLLVMGVESAAGHQVNGHLSNTSVPHCVHPLNDRQMNSKDV